MPARSPAAGEKPFTVTFKSKTHALAALLAAEKGSAVIDALHLVQDTSTIEAAVADMRRQMPAS